MSPAQQEKSAFDLSGKKKIPAEKDDSKNKLRLTSQGKTIQHFHEI